MNYISRISVKIVFFLLGILLLNCNKEQTNLEHNHQVQQIGNSLVKRLSFDQLLEKDETFNRLSESYLVRNLRKGIKLKNTAASDELIITSDTINVIEQEDYKSYTIRVKRPFKNYHTENLIIEEKGGVQNAFILSYLFDNDWIRDYVKGINSHNPKGKVYYTEYDPSNLKSKNKTLKSGDNCQWMTVIVVTPCGCGHSSIPPCQGCEGATNKWPVYFTANEYICFDNNGGSGEDGDVNIFEFGEGGVETGGSSGTGGDTGSGSGGSTTQAQMEDTYELDLHNLNHDLADLSPYNSVKMDEVMDSIRMPNSENSEKANKKLLCLYQKLTTSDTYKNLFTNIFSESENLNVSFKVTKDLKDGSKRLNGRASTMPGSARNSTTREVTRLNILIEIDEDLLNSNSNFNAAKTILHESIHAYLILKLLNCDPGISLNSYDGIQLSNSMFLLYENACDQERNQHELMFDYMLPTFQDVFNEIGNINLTSQTSINNVEGSQLPLDNNPAVDWNWHDFYLYFSMQGLHESQAFQNQIENNSLKNDLYNAYSREARRLSKTCSN